MATVDVAIDVYCLGKHTHSSYCLIQFMLFFFVRIHKYTMHRKRRNEDRNRIQNIQL